VERDGVEPTPQVVTAEERALIIKVARCELIWRADREDVHPCHAVVRSQNGAGEYDRQVPEAWAGNLHGSRLVFLSSNPSISEPGSGQPLDSAEDYPRASSTDHTIVEFQGRRFDQTLPAPFVKNGRYLQQNGHYAHSPTKFWTSIQRRAEELLGPTADPSVNYVMTEVVHCKSKNEVGVSQAAGTCAKRYLNDMLALTNAPIVAVVGKQSHDCLNDALGLGLPEPPYITQKELGGLVRHLVFVWHPAGFRGPKTITGLYGEKELQRLRKLRQAH
jgi:hypothetical protein